MEGEEFSIAGLGGLCPPAKNWGVWEGFAPQPKIGASGGQRPPAKIRGEIDFFSKIFENIFEKNPFHL